MTYLCCIEKSWPLAKDNEKLQWEERALLLPKCQHEIQKKVCRSWCFSCCYVLIWCGAWKGLPRRHNCKESACQCRRCKRHGFDPWFGKIPWNRKWHPLQYSCLENSMDRGARQAIWGHKGSDMDWACTPRSWKCR